MKDAMTPKERWLAAIHLDPVDHLPFWPKLGGNYPGAQVAPYNTMSNQEIHQLVGSEPHEFVNNGTSCVRSKTKVTTTNDGNIQTTVYNTPYGDMKSWSQYDEPSGSWHPMEFPVKEPEDIKRMTACYEDSTIVLDKEKVKRAKELYRKIGDAGVVADGIGESPLMNFVEHIAGVANAHFFLADYPDEVEELFEAQHRVILDRAALVAEHGVADITYLTENTSTTLISPDQYKQWCAPYISAYGQILRAAGKPLVLHMCGHLKDLLPQLAKLPVSAFEAFTSPTLGNTTLLDGRSNCPDKCLIGGTNAVLWTKPAEEIIAVIEHDLSELPNHKGIVVTSAGVMPPACKPETIKSVCDWVHSYNCRN